MIRLLVRLGNVARQVNPDFLLIPQNVSDLISSPEVVQAIDGISQEAIWFDGTVDNDPPGDCPLPRYTAEAGTPAYLARLSSACRRAYYDGRAEILDYAHEEYVAPQYLAARAAGLATFNIEYALQPENVYEAVQRSRSLGTAPFVGSRALAEFIPPMY
jgi:endo-alpha-1,4-polygalactosaminidase (GH114 family)